MFCKHCGTAVSSDASFCKSCGVKIGQAASFSNIQTAVVFLIFAVAAIILLAISGGIGYGWTLRSITPFLLK